MHDYAIFGHDRASVGRWLGFGSILISGGINQFFIKLSAVSGWEAFTKGTVTVGIVYMVLHWLFNKWAWNKAPYIDIPDLTGIWEVDGKTLDESGNTKYPWEGELDIEQNWKQISVNVKTRKSRSKSYTATLMKRSGVRGGWVLSYSYKNEPNLDQIHELQGHKGYCEIEFNSELTHAEATYFNSGGRKTYGIMSIKRAQHDRL
ncbi:Cap15 family CBASS effector [Vibrio parahaemolyticus]|uniref:Cap15 family cyclic dinucleotide receptor domain-containing protein n=1 Tax=Vibrio parahaemolyticus TaxID=670 RepID=UPI0011241A76|nr:pancortin-3 [Vibrio parahaemolyticus]EJG1669870.1 pancortin-3 [Vibrio parahaemolyticus]EJG1777871.1 pancortin-3 [Vibrio parahaemolyticus]TOJ25229.1 pancortin-3 [Vibrio parahaemolyticus]TOJ59678.1 pancortin-3 [Vibrio parahaemolyticus]